MEFQASRPNVLQSSVGRASTQQQSNGIKPSLMNIALGAGVGLATGDWSGLANAALPGAGALFGNGGFGSKSDGEGENPIKFGTEDSEGTITEDLMNAGTLGSDKNQLASQTLTPQLGQPLWVNNQQNQPQQPSPVDAASAVQQYFFDPFAWPGGL